MPEIHHFPGSDGRHRRGWRLRGRALGVIGAGLLSVLPVLPVQAQENAAVGNAAIIAQECGSCHAAAAVGRRIPPLWGLDQNQFIAAMEAFRAGTRDNPTMVIIARGLSPQAVFELARHFAELPAPAN